MQKPFCFEKNIFCYECILEKLELDYDFGRYINVV